MARMPALFFALNKAKEGRVSLFIPPGLLAHLRATFLLEVSSIVLGNPAPFLTALGLGSGKILRSHPPRTHPRCENG